MNVKKAKKKRIEDAGIEKKKEEKKEKENDVNKTKSILLEEMPQEDQETIISLSFLLLAKYMKICKEV